MNSCRKREIRRKVKPKDFRKEKENRFKYFKVRYKQWNEIMYRTGEYQRKVYVERILDNPINSDITIEVIEIVDDG